jgi:V/A-type H+-transporting ATPase subunit E
MPLEDIIAKIAEEARKECDAVQAQAEFRAREIQDKVLRAARQEAERIALRADLDLEEIERRRALIAELEDKKNSLVVRRKAVDEAFALAEQKLARLSEEDWEKLLTRHILAGCETGEEELAAPPQDKEKYLAGLLDRLNKELTAQGKKGGLTLSGRPAGFSGGVLISGKNSDYDASFAALLQSVRAEYEKEIADLLFTAEV